MNNIFIKKFCFLSTLSLFGDFYVLRKICSNISNKMTSIKDLSYRNDILYFFRFASINDYDIAIYDIEIACREFPEIALCYPV